jgi:hypothetical protein
MMSPHCRFEVYHPTHLSNEEESHRSLEQNAACSEYLYRHNAMALLEFVSVNCIHYMATTIIIAFVQLLYQKWSTIRYTALVANQWFHMAWTFPCKQFILYICD